MKYLKGFGKGLFAMILLFAALLIPVQIVPSLNDLPVFNTVVWLSGVLYSLFLYKKFKIRKIWFWVVVLFSVFSLPFIFGDREVQRD